MCIRAGIVLQDRSCVGALEPAEGQRQCAAASAYWVHVAQTLKVKRKVKVNVWRFHDPGRSL